MYLSSVFVLPCYLVFVWDVCLAPWVAKDFLRPCEIVRIFCLSYFKKFSCFCLFFPSRSFVLVFLLSFLYLHFEKNFVGVFVFIFCSLNLLTWDLVSCVSIGSYPCLWVAQWYYRLALTPETRVLGRVVTERPSQNMDPETLTYKDLLAVMAQHEVAYQPHEAVLTRQEELMAKHSDLLADVMKSIGQLFQLDSSEFTFSSTTPASHWCTPSSRWAPASTSQALFGECQFMWRIPDSVFLDIWTPAVKLPCWPL